MTNAAVFSADFTDLKFIKSRKVCVISVEIPIEQAAAFVAIFGCPNPAEGVPVALARLDQTVEKPLPPMPKEKKRWADMMPSQQAALRCNEPGFWKFLSQQYNEACPNAAVAADFVREACGVESRSILDADPAAGHRWNSIDNEYHNWQRGY